MQIEKELLNSIRLTNEIPFIVGIDGLGCSGKTKLADVLTDALKSNGFQVVNLHLDDFIFPKKIRYDHRMDEWYCYYHLQWRYEYLIKEILLPLHKKENLKKEIEIYNKDQDTYELKKLSVDLNSNTIILVEGIFLHRPALLPFFHFTIFINSPNQETRLERAFSRDTYIGDSNDIKIKYEKRYFPAEEQYLYECSPHKKATIRI